MDPSARDGVALCKGYGRIGPVEVATTLVLLFCEGLSYLTDACLLNQYGEFPLCVAGKLLGLHSGDGRVLWGTAFGSSFRPAAVLLFRSSHDPTHPPEACG